jgi:hypothetical protein
MYPIGNAEFDNLLGFSLPKNRKSVRSALSIRNEDIVISYIGRPPGAVYGQNRTEDRKDVNTDVLMRLFIASCLLAESIPRKRFHFLNLPHPAEKEMDYLIDLKQNLDRLAKPPNMNFLTIAPDKQKRLGVRSLQICAAADLNCTIRSSLGVQSSLFGVLDQTRLTPLTLHTLFRDNDDYLEPEAHPYKMSQLVYKAAPYVRDPQQLPSAIYESLFNRGLKEIAFKNQRKLAQNYHFGEKSVAKRAAFTIDLYNQHPTILSGFQNSAFANL